MTISEMAERVNALGSAWEQFKEVNNRRLSELERKGSSDPLYTEHLERVGRSMDECKERMHAIETASLRPGFEAGAPAETGEQLRYKQAFGGYLRKGYEHGLQELSSKALSVGSDADGGYLVTASMSERINKTIDDHSPLRQLASVETISTDALEVIDDAGEAGAGWTTETAAVADTTTPQVGKRSIAVHELFAQPKATQKLVDDASIDIEAWVAQKVAEVFAAKESAAFVSGTGSGQPKGILSYADGTGWEEIEQLVSGSAGAVTADSIIRLFFALKEGYAARASFLMHRSTLQAVRLLKSTETGQYLWQPGLAAGAPDTLMGIPVHTASDMPVAQEGALSIAVADFKSAYQIVDRSGVRVLRDPYTDKPFVKFYTTKRVGGDVANFEAIKLLKLAA